jgi:hypothetical protein
MGFYYVTEENKRASAERKAGKKHSFPPKPHYYDIIGRQREESA